MPRNIEIKASVEGFSQVKRLAEALADEDPIEIQQLDTFFRSTSGRLKLREFDDSSGELIYYRRPEQEGPKESVFFVIPAPAPGALKLILKASNGILGVVKKRRLLYLIGQTRLHLDSVEGLGEFIELEVVLREEQSTRDGVEIAEELMSKLEISRNQLIKGAYFDLLQKIEAEKKGHHQEAPSHFYLRRHQEQLPALSETEVEELIIEICSDGFVTREVGIDAAGRVIHRSPTAVQPYCLAGAEAIDAKPPRASLNREDFERLWAEE